MLQTSAGNEMAGCMNTTISKGLYLILGKNGKKEKIVVDQLQFLSTIHSLRPDSPPILRCCRITHLVSRGKENNSKGKTDFTLFTPSLPLTLRARPHWFCVKWMRPGFNGMCGFGLLRANCARPWQLEAGCWDPGQRDTQQFRPGSTANKGCSCVQNNRSRSVVWGLGLFYHSYLTGVTTL